MKQLTVSELKQWMQEGRTFQLIDVREPFEHEAFNIGGALIPLGDITREGHRLPTGLPLVLYCRKGIRSVIAIQRLLEKNPALDCYNLQGGMEAWQKEGG